MIPAKLGAFVREYGRGTLLIRPAQCAEADAFDRFFTTVWRVDSLEELAALAESAGLLAPFRRQTPLNQMRFERARDRLLNLAMVHHHYQRVLPLARQLLEHPRTADVPRGSVDDIRRLIYDLQRHLGRYADAVGSATSEVRRLTRHSEWSSYDEQARAAAALASALFDAHRFGEARDLLSSWYERIQSDAGVVSPLARVMVYNTLGRVDAITGGDWEQRFRASLALQRVTDPPGRARTFYYLAHALLRHRRWTARNTRFGEGSSAPAVTCFQSGPCTLHEPTWPAA